MADDKKTEATAAEKAAAEAASKPTTAEIKAQLDQIERTTGGSGAIPMAPKQMLLDAKDVADKHPDMKLRWVNIRDPQKAGARQFQGYRRLTSEEGGRMLGDELALFAIPRERWAAMVEHNQRVHADRLVAHKHEMERAVESVAREMNDRYGVRMDVNRIMINE